MPEGIRLVFLPSYSPEVERVWPLVNEGVANRYFQDLGEMLKTVAEPCRVLEGDPQTLRQHTLFHVGLGRKHQDERILACHPKA